MTSQLQKWETGLKISAQILLQHENENINDLSFSGFSTITCTKDGEIIESGKEIGVTIDQQSMENKQG